MKIDAGREILKFNPVGAHNSGLDVSSVATLAIPAGADKLMLQAITQNCRYTLDGTAATTSVGFQLKAADPPRVVYVGSDAVIKVIEEAGTAVLQYQFGK